MSRITFINPNLQRVPIPNLGLAYIISSAETRHQVNLIDLTFHSQNYLSYLMSQLQKNPPEVVGFSVTSFSFQAALNIASELKKFYPQVPIIFGGVHTTLFPEESLSNPAIDAVCIGEGEETIREYLDCIEQKHPPRGVAGLWYKENGKIIRNPLRPFNENLDTIPFPNWDYWEVKKYIEISPYLIDSITVLASRGCPYQCSFCSNPVIMKIVPGRYYRTRKPEKIIQEIESIYEKYNEIGFKVITFTDETFGLDRNQLDNICQLFIKKGFNGKIPWICNTRADIITRDWIKQVAEAGCSMITLGIESGDDYIRMEQYKKNITQEQIANAVELLRRYNIMYQFNMMGGCPEETRETFNKSLAMIKKFNPIIVHFSFYQPLPKTELSERMKEKLKLDDENFINYWNTPRIKTGNLTPKEMKNLMLKHRIQWAGRFLKHGVQLRGLSFILDIFRYIFSVGISRKVPLKDPYARVDLSQKTVHRYALDLWKKQYREHYSYIS